MEVLTKSISGNPAQWMFLFGLCLMIFILLVRSRRYFRQVARHQKSLSPPNRIAPKSKAVSSAYPPKEHEQWEVAMHELARDLSGQLDSKIRILEMLIREANQTAARLDASARTNRGKLAAPSASPKPRSRRPRICQTVRANRRSRESRSTRSGTLQPPETRSESSDRRIVAQLVRFRRFAAEIDSSKSAIRASLRSGRCGAVPRHHRQPGRQPGRRSRTHPQPPRAASDRVEKTSATILSTVRNVDAIQISLSLDAADERVGVRAAEGTIRAAKSRTARRGHAARVPCGNRNSFEYLTAAMQASFAGQPTPSLLSGV